MDSRNVHTNCLKIQFGSSSKMPTDKEIFAFFREREWASDSLCAMFREPREYSVYVKFQSEDLMKAALLKSPPSVRFTYDNDQTVLVTFATARGNFRYVRLFGVPIEVDEKHVATVLSKYGKIHHMIRERFGADTGYPILNGVRGVHMEISTDIPPQLHVQHFQVRVFYEGMQNKCFACGSPEHVKASCPKRKSVSFRLRQNDAEFTSYAGALLGMPIIPKPSTSEMRDKSTKEKDVNSNNEGQMVVEFSMPATSATLQNEASATSRTTTDAVESTSLQRTSSSTEQAPDEELATHTGPKETESTDYAKEQQTDPHEWTPAKKRDRTSRKDERGASNSSDSSDAGNSKIRLLENQSQRTRSRSHRMEDK